MINCLIIDDEQPAINIIQDYIKEIGFLKLVGTTTNPIEGLSMINTGAIDLVFSDIHMPYLTGTDLAKACNGKSKIIFTTAHDKYAIESFEMDIIDYLLKPIPFPRFLKAVQKAKTIIESHTPLKLNGNKSNEEYILVRGNTKGTYIKVELKEIEYIEATGNYLCVICNNRKIIAHNKMSSIQNLLPEQQFIRVHKSFIINISQISSISGNSIKLKNNVTTPILIGSTYKDSFLKIMRNRLADN